MKVAAAVEVVALWNLRAIGAFARRDVGLTSDDRLDAVLDGFAEELDRAEHVAMVGDGHRGHPGGVGVLEQRVNLVGTVEQTVLGMNVQMGEAHQGRNLLLATTTAVTHAAHRNAPMRALAHRRYHRARRCTAPCRRAGWRGASAFLLAAARLAGGGSFFGAALGGLWGAALGPFLGGAFGHF